MEFNQKVTLSTRVHYRIYTAFTRQGSEVQSLYRPPQILEREISDLPVAIA
jgi:hypothetical protein